jgi:hypothetical protein
MSSLEKELSCPICGSKEVDTLHFCQQCSELGAFNNVDCDRVTKFSSFLNKEKEEIQKQTKLLAEHLLHLCHGKNNCNMNFNCPVRKVCEEARGIECSQLKKT